MIYDKIKRLYKRSMKPLATNQYLRYHSDFGWCMPVESKNPHRKTCNDEN